MHFDAAPSPESGAPDPLTPRRSEAPAPLAPGAPKEEAQAAPAGEADPVVVLVRQRLEGPAPRNPGDREDQAAALAYYNEISRPIWTDATGFTSRGRQAVEEIGKADDWGLKASSFSLPTLAEASPTPEALAEAEAKVALAVLKYARHARGGRVDPSSISRLLDQKPVIYQPKSVLQAMAVADGADAYLRALHPTHPQFERLRQALLATRASETITDGASRGKAVAGAQQIIANMERWRWMPADLGSFYVWDSVPDQMTYVIDNGKTVLVERIVVGKPTTPTPIFSADMQFVIFNPSWGVPSGIKTNELWPMLRNAGGGWFSTKPLASSVLRANGLEVRRGGAPINPDSIDWNQVDIRNFDFIQPPGPTNVLGMVKFRFPNKHDVYMHDTPERHLFNGGLRAFSHGCMRVQNPMRLAELLLGHDKGWSAESVRQQSRSGSEIRLTNPIPVHVSYFTIQVDDAGNIVRRADIYGLDNRVATALEGRDVRIAAMTTAAASSDASGVDVKPERTKKKDRRKTAQPSQSSYNPFAALFGD
jgi:murein L,D-transpeptidase YcbB/YkuD